MKIKTEMLIRMASEHFTDELATIAVATMVDLINELEKNGFFAD